VNTERVNRVVIDIVQGADTVSGRVAVGDGAATEFFGWIELIDRLQSAATVDVVDATAPGDGAGAS
jgi:hypothetical protein